MVYEDLCCPPPYQESYEEPPHTLRADYPSTLIRKYYTPTPVCIRGSPTTHGDIHTKIKHSYVNKNTPKRSSNVIDHLYLQCGVCRAEEYFKRSVLAEPPDAEAFSRYADFLWLERKDLWAAEERYLQALEADHGSGNTFYASKYARFLWSTCGDDVCFYPPEDGATW